METNPKLPLEARLLERIRYFNRRFFNPFALSFAGRPNSFWSAVMHTGRRSGMAYITPIMAARQDGSIVIPLPYGKDVDWFRNVVAAGECHLVHQGNVFHAAQPEMIPLAEGVGAFTGWIQVSVRRLDSIDMLRLNQVEVLEDSDKRYQAFEADHPLSRGLWVLAAIGFLIIGRISRAERCKRSGEN